MHHTSVYEFNFKFIKQLYDDTNEFRRPLSYEKLFDLIEVLDMLWNNYAQKQPELWQAFAIEAEANGGQVCQVLLKAAYRDGKYF